MVAATMFDLLCTTLWFHEVLSTHFDYFINCFDARFKIFFALDLDYSLFGYRFWLYVQREIFKTNLGNDKAFQLSGLISLLMNHVLKRDDLTNSSINAQNIF
jgi:hypothetical protein